MKEIIVLGGGEAGLSFIKTIKDKNCQIKITLVDRNNFYFDKTNYLRSLSVNNWFSLKEWAEENDIEFINAEVEKLAFKKRKIHFKDRETIDFESVILSTGLKSKNKVVKGEHRDGFFYISQIEPAAFKKLLKIIKDVVIYISTILGLRLALSLHSLSKEINIVGGDWGFLGEYKEKMLTHLKDKNIPVYLDSSVEEAIGEGVVKATKILPLKVFSSQLLLLDTGFYPNLDYLEEELMPKDIFFTDYTSVYLLGDVNDKEASFDSFFVNNKQSAIEQGKIFADFIIEGKPPVFERKEYNWEVKQKLIEQILNS